jgi:isoamylase
MGATWIPSLNAWNFALYSRRATGVSLLLYSAEDPVNALLEYRLDVRANKSARIWHCWVPAAQVPNAAYYAWRVEGRHDPAAGYRFDSEKTLLDPFAPAVYFPPDYDREASCQPGSNAGRAPLGVLPKTVPAARDTNVDRKVRASHDLIVYELHVRGFTLRANSGVSPEGRLRVWWRKSLISRTWESPRWN